MASHTPSIGNKVLPGSQDKDYQFVTSNGKYYIVYAINLAGGKQLKISWSLSAADIKTFGLNPQKAKAISGQALGNIQYLGRAQDLTWTRDVHPWQRYVDKLQQLYGRVSWLNDPQFMATMLQGRAEGWSATETQQALTKTKWYQSRTTTQRNWLTLSRAEQRAQIKAQTVQMQATLRDLYGADYDLTQVMTPDQIQKTAARIASGQFGDASTGLQLWSQKMRLQAEGVQGSPAWISREQGVEAQRAFANRPEDMFQQIRDEARFQLGPSGMPSDEVLKKWADALTSATASTADWKAYLQKQSTQLYPWLDPGTAWQDAVDPYKRMAEQTWGQPISYSDPILRSLGGTDSSGKPTGGMLDFYSFEKALRSDQRWWVSPGAYQQGYQLVDYMNNLFRGVS